MEAHIPNIGPREVPSPASVPALALSTAPHVAVRVDENGYAIGANCKRSHGGNTRIRESAPRGYYQCCGCLTFYHSSELV